MTDQALTELKILQQTVLMLVKQMAPFIGQSEMQARYGGVTGQTLLAMERRGEIPTRVKGRWVRADVLVWEQGLIPH